MALENSSISLPVLRENNPYSVGSVFSYPDGSVTLDREKVVYTKSDNDRYYTVIQGETLSNISFQAYGDSKYWWIIADVNNLDFVLDLQPGITLIIPDLNQIKITNL